MDHSIDEWVRCNKRSFARDLISKSGAIKTSKPSAIFMAGLPGVGKTEFTKSWISNSGLKVIRLDMDEIASNIDGYSPEIADQFRVPASALLNHVLDKILIGKYDFIMDGTFGGGAAIKNIERAVSHGYRIKIIYIHQLPKLAWEYTVAREKIEHRAIDLDGFIETYYKVISNLRRLDALRGERVSIDLIEKNSENGVKRIKEDISIEDIELCVKLEYNKDNLKRSLYEQN